MAQGIERAGDRAIGETQEVEHDRRARQALGALRLRDADGIDAPGAPTGAALPALRLHLLQAGVAHPFEHRLPAIHVPTATPAARARLLRDLGLNHRQDQVQPHLVFPFHSVAVPRLTRLPQFYQPLNSHHGRAALTTYAARYTIRWVGEYASGATVRRGRWSAVPLLRRLMATLLPHGLVSAYSSWRWQQCRQECYLESLARALVRPLLSGASPHGARRLRSSPRCSSLASPVERAALPAADRPAPSQPRRRRRRPPRRRRSSQACCGSWSTTPRSAPNTTARRPMTPGASAARRRITTRHMR